MDGQSVENQTRALCKGMTLADKEPTFCQAALRCYSGMGSKKFQPRDLILGPLHVDLVVDIQDSCQIQTITIAE